MDTALVKHAPPLPFLLPDGTIIHLAPLPRGTIDRIWLEAELELAALGAPPALLFPMVCRRLLEAAAGRDLAGELHQAELFALWRLWARWQRRCHPREDRLRNHLRRRAYDDPEVVRDGWRAHRAGSPGAYYGRPEVDLTDGQVAYWSLLSSAYAEWHVPDPSGRRKEPTNQWLTSDDE